MLHLWQSWFEEPNPKIRNVQELREFLRSRVTEPFKWFETIYDALVIQRILNEQEFFGTSDILNILNEYAELLKTNSDIRLKAEKILDAVFFQFSKSWLRDIEVFFQVIKASSWYPSIFEALLIDNEFNISINRDNRENYRTKLSNIIDSEKQRDNNIFERLLSKDKILPLLLMINPEYIKLIDSQKQTLWFTNPSSLNYSLFNTYNIELRDNGYADSLSGLLLYNALSGSLRLSNEDFREESNRNKKVEISSTDNFSDLLKDYIFEKTLGRTVIFKRESGDQRIALKFKKRDEKNEDFLFELERLGSLEKESHVPTPLGAYLINIKSFKKYFPNDQKYNELRAQINSNSENVEVIVYGFSNASYFEYLHHENITMKECFVCSKRILRDLLNQLMIYGRVYILADLYHNSERTKYRDDDGYYHVLAGLTRADPFELRASGRLTAWKEAVAYPNLRRHGGLADVGDVLELKKDYFDQNSHTIKIKFNAVYESQPEEIAKKIIFANCIAEYLYVFHLVNGVRSAKLCASLDSAEAFKIWLAAAQINFELCIETVHQLTAMHKDFIRRFLMNSIKSLEIYARQMQYWMTAEYINNTIASKVPKDVYPDAEVKVPFEKFRKNTFSSTLGFSINGNAPDLGPVNGPEPVRKIFELINATLYASFTLFNVSAEENLKNTAGKKQKFKRNPYTVLYPCLKENKKLEAALKIQRFFREKTERKYRVNYVSRIINEADNTRAKAFTIS